VLPAGCRLDIARAGLSAKKLLGSHQQRLEVVLANERLGFGE